MNQIHLFGYSNPTGNELKKLLKASSKKINMYGRNSNSGNIFNLDNLESFAFINPKEESTIVSLLPIWHFAYFLEYLYNNKKYDLQNIKKIIVVSSSSVISKKFAFNPSDKLLVQNLISAEKLISKISQNLKIKLTIIRPTLIYGKSDSYIDRNVSVLTLYLRFLPIIFIPKNCGLRQPIHCAQLAKLIKKLVSEDQTFIDSDNSSTIINVGGDEELYYSEMLDRIYINFVEKGFLKRILYFYLPYKIFAILCSPFLIINPKFFEALLRINADLSGFERVSELLNTIPKKFPYKNKND